MARMLSIIMPVLNEAAILATALDALADCRRRGVEVVVVDGGSRDATPEIAAGRADLVIEAGRGRARQMNAGAAIAGGDVFLFLHADTRLPPAADRRIVEGLDASGRAWGRFDVAIAGKSPLFPVIAWAMNRRSRLTGIATGDQAIFVARDAFAEVGGFPNIALMEDVALARDLKRLSPPLCLRDKVITSGRRWETHGVLRTILLMWRLRLAYYFGVAPDLLARRYGHVSGQL